MTEDLALIESLEESKRVADEISEKVVEAKATEEQINEARNKVRSCASTFCTHSEIPECSICIEAHMAWRIVCYLYCSYQHYHKTSMVQPVYILTCCSLALQFRTVADRGAMLFFLLNRLNKIHAFYQYSLNAFVTVFSRAIDVAPGESLLRTALKRSSKQLSTRLQQA